MTIYGGCAFVLFIFMLNLRTTILRMTWRNGFNITSWIYDARLRFRWMQEAR